MSWLASHFLRGQVDELLLDKKQEQQWTLLGQDAAQLRLHVRPTPAVSLPPAVSPTLSHSYRLTSTAPYAQLKFTRKAQGFNLSDVRATIPARTAAAA